MIATPQCAQRGASMWIAQANESKVCVSSPTVISNALSYVFPQHSQDFMSDRGLQSMFLVSSTASSDVRRSLGHALSSGRAILFTGAGFSADARDRAGEPLPVARRMADDLRTLCFGPCEDDSTLQDLYDVASRRHRAALIEYLERRLHVGDHPLPDHHGRWFAAPWWRVYTLNVDDLEVAVARQFALRRPPRPISAVPCDRHEPLGAAARDVLEVVHLNGVVTGDLDTVTFSTLQHARRLVEHCPYYTTLTADLEERTFVFVGTALDEALFWQHLQLRRAHDGDAARRPRSFLVTPRLSRARQLLLEDLRIEWIAGTAEEFADDVLAPLVAVPRRRPPRPISRDPSHPLR